MSRHLQACPARKAAIVAEESVPALKTRLFHLAVQGTYASDYWLHLEMPGNATLSDLDQFLRDIWLECCGHLSMFQIQGQNFMVQVLDTWWGMEDRDMNVELSVVLAPGLKFSYEYDFGSSTDLTLRVVSEREGLPKEDDPVEILARNKPPDYRCERCGKPADYIDVFEDYTLLCEACDETEGYGEGLMPVVNSPRMGVCGYTGDAW
jgi:hypothetical protein